jgi:SAM-dependent methyltransferase
MANDAPDHVAAVVSMFTHGMYDHWASQTIALWEQERKLLAAYCPNIDARFLVVGCGAGRETLAMCEQGYRHLSAVDATAALLDVARKQAAARGCTLDFQLADASSLPYADATFDVVTMFANIYGHITPKTIRLRALGEVYRVLKPKGLVLMEAQSLRSCWRHYLAIRLMDLGHRLWNPYDLEPGDKLMRGAKKTPGAARSGYARTHWFRALELDAEAAQSGFDVLLRSTVKGVRENPTVSSSRWHDRGRFMYVLQKATP